MQRWTASVKTARRPTHAPRKIAGIKSFNDYRHVRRNVLAAMGEMNSPLIATHKRPDCDALGSSIALALHLKEQGKNPSLFMLAEVYEKLPTFFRDAIFNHGINIVGENTLAAANHDGLILLDAAGASRLEAPIQNLRETLTAGRDGKSIPVIDIDHHYGEELMAPKNLTIVNNKASSASELLASLLGKEMSQSTAPLLFAGILADSRNLNFMIGANTRERVAIMERRTNVDRNPLYEQIKNLSLDDKRLIAECLDGSLQVITASIGENRNKAEYRIMPVVVHKDQLSGEHRRWKDDLKDQLGFNRLADIVLIIYYVPSESKYRCSVSLYNKAVTNGTALNLQPVAEALREGPGGGHAGAVTFDFHLERYAGNHQTAIDYIVAGIERHCGRKPSLI